MKFHRKKVATALALLGAGGAVSLSAIPAMAQDIRVDVTGSNIKRVEGEGPTAVQVITRDEITKSGVQTTQELMQRVSANMSANNFNELSGIGTSLTGFSGVSLRGLGTSRSLVLLNGRRLSNYSIAGSSVDISSIPFAAIERVEVLKDGASAVYGSDAIAGVVNFILRKDFTGLDAYYYYGDSEAGGGKQWRATVAGGWGDLTKDKFNVFGMYDYLKTDPITALQRSFSNTVYRPDIGMDSTSGNTIPSSISQPGGFSGTRNPGVPNCLPPFSIITTNPNVCRFDFGATINITPPTEKQTALGKVTWQINPDNQFFAEASWYKGEFTYAISPTPVFNGDMGVDATGKTNVPLLYPTSKWYPTAFVASLPNGKTNLPVTLAWRALSAGPRTNVSDVETDRVVAGLQGNIKGWDYNTAVNWNKNKLTDNYTSGYLDGTKLANALASGVINPFGSQDAAGAAAIEGATVREVARSTEGKTFEWDGRVSNEIYNLPGGPLGMALGGEWRKEELSQTYSNNYILGNYVGGAGAIPPVADADRTVWAAFAEFNIPIVKTLEANVAIRYDNYSDFGSTWNPKVSLRWQPNRDLLFRGAWGTGFRAPALTDLYQPLLTTNSGGNYSDPLRCPATGLSTDCNLQVNIKSGGNPLLKPETSTNWTLGAVWSPSNGFSFGVDYYNIKLDQVIGTNDETYVINKFQNSPVTTFSGGLGIARLPVEAQYPTLPGPIDFYLNPLFNLGKIETSGLDFDISAKLPPLSWGTFTLGFNGTYVDTFKQSSEGGTGPVEETVGSRTTSQGAVPRWRHYATVNWAYGPWNATLAQTYQLGYTEYPETAAAAAIFGDSRHVGSYSLLDLQGQYTGFKNWTLSLGVKNLLDTDPPVSIINQGFVLGWDKLYADPTGRFFYGSVRYSFK